MKTSQVFTTPGSRRLSTNRLLIYKGKFLRPRRNRGRIREVGLVNAERPIYLVLDGHPVHRSKKVRDFVEAQDGKLKLFFLPPYSPELNPDELVWNVIKGQVSGRTVVEDKQTLRRLVRGALMRLQRSTEKLKKLFHEPNVAYILADCRV